MVTPRIGRVNRGATWMVVCSALLHACDTSTGPLQATPAVATPESTAISSAVVGSTLSSPVRLVVSGADGRPVAGAKVLWVATDGHVSSAESISDARGVATVRWTLGFNVGMQRLSAFIPGLSPVLFDAVATPDRAAVVRLSSDLVRVTLLGDTVRFTATSQDQFGNDVNTPITFSLEGATSALSLAGSSFVARNRGTAIIRATADTATARLRVLVDPSPPGLISISPDTLRPGSPIVIQGVGFALVPEAVEVTVAGIKATVNRVTATRVEATIATAYGCLATAPQAVEVRVAGLSGEGGAVFKTATRLSLSRGESANLLNSDEVRCVELAVPRGGSLSAKYVVAVINTNVTAASASGFELRGAGAGAGALATRVAVSRPVAALSTPLVSARDAGRLAPLPWSAPSLRPGAPIPSVASFESPRDMQHEHQLDTQRAIGTRYGSAAPMWRARLAAGGGRATAIESRAPLVVGDTIAVKALYSSCLTGHNVRARVVFAGIKAVILEDITAPRAGTMDLEYQLIGTEYDHVQYPLMASKVGDPLAMDALMNGDARVTMLFTRYVNDSLPGVAGYVSVCNFYPKSTITASAEDELIYARVANSSESPSAWRRAIRGTLIHESKHLASFALRFIDGTPFEENWLEESTGRMAEELYSRTFANGPLWRSNTDFADGARCEILQCDDRPLMMWKHFSVLHQYLRASETLTPIGPATNGDFTFYASGWSLVRWAADHYAAEESAWLKALVRGGRLTGLSNLSQRTGRPAAEMLADWSLALAVDDLSGFSPIRPQLTFASWDFADVFAGLATLYPDTFLARPLKTRALTFGAFSVPVAKLRAFSSSYFSFEGMQSGSQMLELRGENGVAASPTTLRLAIVRVE